MTMRRLGNFSRSLRTRSRPPCLHAALHGPFFVDGVGEELEVVEVEAIDAARGEASRDVLDDELADSRRLLGFIHVSSG